MSPRYLDPTNDVAFKRVFGEKKRLISFLNSILRLEEGEKIKDLEFISPEEIPDFGIGKRAVFDLKVQDEAGNYYVVEMQNRKEEFFLQRMEFYAYTAYTNQARKGFTHAGLMPVVLIAITRNKVLPDEVECVNRHYTLESITKKRYLFGVSYVFVELEKFKKKAEELETLEDYWLYFLADWNEAKAPPKMIKDEAVLDAFENIEQFNWTEAQYDAYIRAKLAADAEALTIEKSYEDGLEKGITEGIAEGEAKEKVAIAKRLLQAGVDIELISKSTGLDPKEIEKLTLI